MAFLVPFLLVYFAAAALVLAALLVLLCRLFPRVRRTWVGVIAGAVAIAMTPLPGHGTMMLLFPTMIVEGLRESRAPRDAPQAALDEAELETRFEGYLSDARAREHWRDTASGLVWGDRVATVPDVSPASFSQAQLACRALKPRGYWAVPRTAEFYFLSKAGRLEGTWIAELLVAPGSGPVAAQVRRDAAAARNGPGLAVRCVAVTPPAPRRGYLTSDIPLDDWNRYQLGLVVGAP